MREGEEVGAERLDYKEFDGNLFKQIDECNKYLKEHISIMSRLHPYQIQREDITPNNITEKQFSRNPVIAKVLAKVRYIEELGEGWDKIIKEHREHPLKPHFPKI